MEYTTILLDILQLEQQELALPNNITIQELIDYVISTYDCLQKIAQEKIVVRSQNLQKILHQNQNLYQILGDQLTDKFFIEINQQAAPQNQNLASRQFQQIPQQQPIQQQQPANGTQVVNQEIPLQEVNQLNKIQQQQNFMSPFDFLENVDQNNQPPLNQSQQQQPQEININISYNDDLQIIGVPANMTLEELLTGLKEALSIKENVGIFFNNQFILNKKLKLSDAKVTDNSTIYLKPQDQINSANIQFGAPLPQNQYQSQEQQLFPFQPQQSQYYQCKVCQQHGQEIYAVCFNSACNQSKLVCFDCITAKLHFEHLDSLKKYSDLEGILNQKKSECNNLLSKLDDMLNEILFVYSMLKQGINNKFVIPKERINQMNNNNFSQYLSNIIQFDEQSENIINKMKEDCEDFANKIKNNMIELELDQLNYIEVSKENQEEAQKLFYKGYTMYYDKGYFQEAIKLFDQALIINPNHICSLHFKGASLSKLGQYKESTECYDKAIAIDPFLISSLSDKNKKT